MYLFNGISTPLVLFKVEIRFIWKWQKIIITFYILVWVSLFSGEQTSFGLFNTEIWFICKCLTIIITIYILVWIGLFNDI